MLFLEALALILLLILVAAGLLTWRLSKGPLDMDVLRPQVESALENARGGRPVKIDSLALAWSPDKKRIEVTVSDITAYSEENKIQARAEHGAVWFDTASLVQGKINIVKFRLENGFSALHRDEFGQWKIVSPEEELVAPNQIVQETKPDTRLGDWRDWIDQIREQVDEQSFQSVEFSNFDFKITDSITGLDWLTEDASGVWEANNQGLTVDVSGDLEGLFAPQSIQLRFFSDAEIENFSVELGLVEANPERLIALLTKENYDIKYDGEVDLNIGATASVEEGLLTAQVSAAGEAGALVFSEDLYDVESTSVEAHFDFKERQIDLVHLSLETEKVKGIFSGSANIADYFNGTEFPIIPYNITAEGLWLDIQPMFETSWDINSADVTGTVNTETMSLEIESAKGKVKNFEGAGSGRVYLEPKIDIEGEESKPLGQRIGVELKAIGAGKVTPRQVLDFWPLKLGSGARNWAKENILGGRATTLNFQMDFPPGTNSKPLVPDKLLTLDFTVEDAEISILSDLPPLEKAFGTGRLRGNSLTIDVQKATLGEWIIDEGEVDLPAFHPAGAISTYTAATRGDLKGLMKILEGSRLNTCTDFELACDRMSGLGGLDISIKRPMKEGTTIDDMIIDVTGGFVEAEAPDLAFGFGLIKTDVTVDLDNDALEIRGAGRFGTAPAEFTWKQIFETEQGTSLRANAVVTPDLFNSLGLAARSFMQGEADLELEAVGDGKDFQSVDMHVDFTGSALNLSEIGWLKPLYVPATGEIRYGKGNGGAAVLTGDIEAKGLELAGELTFDDDKGLQRATIERIYSENRLDMRGDLVRTENGDVKINISGPFFDASPWIDGLTEFGKGGSGPGVNVHANIAVDKLKLRDDAQLINSKIVLDMNPNTLERGLVSGTISRAKGLEATFERDGEDFAVQLRADDAGYVLKTLFDVDYLKGGTLNLNGLMGKEFGAAEMNMKNVRMKGAPILAQVFALASLRGLTDVLNGDGVMFTEIQAPIRLNNGRLELPGVRASGPAMGLTTRGWLQMDSGDLNLDGVVVPSFGVNSALGGIPIIGDLFVSRQGEGVFAVTYSVRGTLERARVAINPLSAVTPGFLRRIMENPNEQAVNQLEEAPETAE